MKKKKSKTKVGAQNDERTNKNHKVVENKEENPNYLEDFEKVPNEIIKRGDLFSSPHSQKGSRTS